MIKKFNSFIFLLTLTTSILSAANNLDWKGGYRFEFVEIDKPSLTNPSLKKSYGLNYLYLAPRIEASDGINIVSRFEIFSNVESNYNSYLGSQWGRSEDKTSSPSKSSAFGHSADSMPVKVSQLYLNISQENASFIIGRAPFYFGIGMNYSLGDGLFDHWNNNRDQIAYKFLINNLTLMPFFARHSEDGYQQGSMTQDEGFLVQYENKDSGSLIGVMLERRKASVTANDVPVDLSVNPGAVGDSRSGDLNVQRTNFILGRDWDSFGFRLEAGFLSGEIGALKGGQSVKVNGYGIASEWNFKTGSNWSYLLKAGIASGDNPETNDFEGFFFDKNYDVAFLLFNHRLGLYDVLRTGANKNVTVASGLHAGNTLDDEAISNAFYVSPVLKYRWNEKLDFNQYLTWAQLVTSPLANNGASKDLGFEWDLEFVYKAREKVQWVNQMGFLFPGSAFKPNSIPGADSSFTYGLTSKIAVQF